MFLRQEHLPPAGDLRDRLLCRIMGSPHIRQVDGLGGGYPGTSKIAIIGPPSVNGVDVDYLFGQVAIDAARVDYSANCGNIAAAVGPFAINEGLVAASDAAATIRIHNVNTGRILVAEVPVADGAAAVSGSLRIDGVAGQGAPIFVDYRQLAGAKTGKLLPTGRVRDCVRLGTSETVDISICDFGNLMVFADARDMGIAGNESAAALSNNPVFVSRQREVRGRAAMLLGLVDDWTEADLTTPIQPTVQVVSPPGNVSSAADIVSRFMFMNVCHDAVAGTGGLCLAVASHIPGSVAHDVARHGAEDVVRIAHPAGIADIVATIRPGADVEPVIGRCGMYRTARPIMAGVVFVPNGRKGGLSG